VRSVINDPLQAESLVLAAGLSTTVADELVHEAEGAAAHELDLLAARALVEGARPSPTLFLQHVESLRRRLSTAAAPRVRWEMAQAITRPAIPADRQSELLDDFERYLPASHHIVARALAYARWNINTKEAEETLREVLQIEAPPALGPAAPPGRVVATVDQGFADAVELAAAALLPAHPELADDVARARWRTSVGTMEKLEQLLFKYGHRAALRNAVPSHLRGLRESATAVALDDTPDRLLILLVSELAPPSVLTLSQKRRLTTLGDLSQTLQLPESAMGDLPAALAGYGDDLRFILSTVVTLAGFDPRVLAAEATIALAQYGDEDDQVDLSFLFDDARGRTLAHWEAVADPESLQTGLVALIKSQPWIARVAQRALAKAPNPARVISEVEALLPTLTASQRSMAVQVQVLVDSDQLARCRALLKDEDPVKRSEAARCLGILFRNQEGATVEDIVQVLQDSEASVQEALLEQLQRDNISRPIVVQLKALAAASPTTWHCVRCDTKNSPEQHACTGCRKPAPRPISLAKRLLPVEDPQSSNK
jgi:hypothetical protein